MKSILKTITSIISISFILTFTLVLTTIYSSLKKVEKPTLEGIVYNNITTIYDKDEEMILTLGENKNNEVTFSDLPEVFINALISAEDSKFILHNGIDSTRLLSAMITNIKSRQFSQGGSTLTQQLAKNLFLSNEKTLERKFKEAYIAIKLEENMTKEEIFTTYVNRICFDGSTIGVNSAALKYFSKPISQVTLPEAATLAGMVNAPTLYNPLKNPATSNKRKNIVLDLMVRHGYITQKEASLAKDKNVSSFINPSSIIEPTYEYQAYLDVVYAQALKLTGKDPFLVPMKIYTHMDISTQKIIDNIQSGSDSIISFEDDNQQFATSIIENNTGHIIAVGGGRNYAGQRLYNRAYNMTQQPASTIKPLIYALAIEEFGWNSNKLVYDETYIYKDTQKEVHNADHTHMGELLLQDALGYSRNTTALSTLETLVDAKGKKYIYDYLSSLNIMDTSLSSFNLAYGIGAYYNGVSPINLAGAYSMLASSGNYIEPTTIKKIELNDGTTIYPNNKSKQIISEESAFIISNVLENVVSNNYWGIGALQIDDVSIAAKTGTSSFDKNILQTYSYPYNASKDIWVLGYSPSYTISVWTGFDNISKDEKTYFEASNDSRSKMAKKIFSRLMEYLSTPSHFSIPDGIKKVSVVKGSDYLPDEYTPSSMIIDSYYKSENIPTEYIKPPELLPPDELNYIINGSTLTFTNNINNTSNSKTIFSYDKIYGKTKTIYKITDPLDNISYIEANDIESTYELNYEGEYIIEAYNKYSKIDTLISTPIVSSFYFILEKEDIKIQEDEKKEEFEDFFLFPFDFT